MFASIVGLFGVVLGLAGQIAPRDPFWHSWTFGGLIIAAIVIAACIGIVIVAFRAFGVQVPGWAVQIGWIVVVAFIAIVAIRILLSL